MLARVAENVFWLSRYLERAESTARLINVHDRLLMDLPDHDRRAGWQSLVSIAGMDRAFSNANERADEASVTRFLLADPGNAGSLINAANAIHANLRSSRDTLPQALYERINELCLTIRRDVERALAPEPRQRFLMVIEEKVLAITGTMDGSLSHDVGYLLIRMGCFVERADMTSRILDVRAATLPVRPAADHFEPFDEREWMSVLRSVSAYQMYRLHVRHPINGPDVLRFLLHDERLPRAYHFCLDHLGRCLEQLGNNRAPLDALGRLQRRLAEPDLGTLAHDARALHGYLDDLQSGLIEVTDAIAAAYFPPPEAPAEVPVAHPHEGRADDDGNAGTRERDRDAAARAAGANGVAESARRGAARAAAASGSSGEEGGVPPDSSGEPHP